MAKNNLKNRRGTKGWINKEEELPETPGLIMAHEEASFLNNNGHS